MNCVTCFGRNTFLETHVYVMFLFVVSKFHVCCGEEGDGSKVVLPTSMFELICRLICLAMKFRMLEGIMAVV